MFNKSKLFFLVLLSNLIIFNLSAIPQDFFPNFYSDYVSELNVNTYLGEGHDELQGRLYSIHARGSRYESIDSVMDVVLYKAAMATYENGFTYFTIISNDISEKYFGNTSAHGYVNSYGGVSVYGGDAIFRNTGNIVIYLFNDIEEITDEHGKTLTYYKALNIYTPLTNDQIEHLKTYNQSLTLNVGTGLSFKENIHPMFRVEMEYTHLLKSFGIGASYLFSMHDTDFLKKSDYSDSVYETSYLTFKNSLAVPLKYYLVKPKENKHFYFNFGIRPELIINTKDAFSTTSTTKVGFGIEPNIDLGFYFEEFMDDSLGINIHVGYNINNLQNFLNLALGLSVLMK